MIDLSWPKAGGTNTNDHKQNKQIRNEVVKRINFTVIKFTLSIAEDFKMTPKPNGHKSMLHES